MKNEDEYESLNKEIQSVQIEKFINDFDNSMNRHIKKSLKNLLLVMLPIISSIIGIIVFPSPVTLFASFTIISLLFTISKISKIKSLFNSPQKNNKVLNIREEKDFEEVLNEGIGNKLGSDYYHESIKDTIIEIKKEQNNKQVRESNLKLIKKDNNKNILNKDESMIQIVKELDFYCDVYNLPPLKISNKDWDVFFNILYKKFIEKGIEEFFYESLSKLFKYSLAKTLCDNSKNINIKSFINNLYYLENYKNITKFTKKEILIIQKEILSNIYQNEIIKFKDFSETKERKK